MVKLLPDELQVIINGLQEWFFSPSNNVGRSEDRADISSPTKRSSANSSTNRSVPGQPQFRQNCTTMDPSKDCSKLKFGLVSSVALVLGAVRGIVDDRRVS